MTRLTASLDEWRTPAKRAERQKGYQESAAYMPDGARWLQGVPKMEQEIEAHMAAEVAPGSSLARSIAEQQAAIAAIKTYLTDLGPEHRQAQGCYAKDGKELRTKFRSVPPTGPTPECQGFARANLAFFEKKMGKVDYMAAFAFFDNYQKFLSGLGDPALLDDGVEKLKAVSFNMSTSEFRRFAATKAISDMRAGLREKGDTARVEALGKIIKEIKEKEPDPTLKLYYDMFDTP
jgi:hypothetical protein